MRRGPLVLLSLTLALAGCFTHATSEEATGPGPLVTLVNHGPHDASITLTVTLPNGTTATDAYRVAAGATDDHRPIVTAEGPVRLRVAYSWGEPGHGAAGLQDAAYDTRECAGTYHVTMDLDTTTNRTASSVHAECGPA